MLRRLPTPSAGEPAASVFDDAALWPIDRHRSLVSTVDFFAPLVDDAHTWGAIAAANSVSDVYAMGGDPLFALNVVAWPRDLLPLDLLGDVLAGGAQVATAGGFVVAGGHSVDAPEPMYGMAVTGTVKTKAALTLAGAQEGNALVLTKPLGTGLLAAAIKAAPPEATAPNGPLAAIYNQGVTEMTRLNDIAAKAALTAKATAATDVTGFGLLGHLREMAQAVGATARVFAAEIPLLPDVLKLLGDESNISGGSRRNLASVEPVLEGGNAATRALLSDPQTSGGLLFSCAPGAATAAVSQLNDSGHQAAVIGEIAPAQTAVPQDQAAQPRTGQDQPQLIIEGELSH